MNDAIAFTEDQRDALQELMNISMGQAANSLAHLIETKIGISIPNITAVTPEQLFEMVRHNQEAHYTRQSFMGDIHGEVMSILSQSGLAEVAELMEYEQPLSDADIKETILELCNILAGACLSGLSEQLELTTNLQMPTLFQPEKHDFNQLGWQHSLVMEVKFDIQISSFTMRVVFCLDDASLHKLTSTIDELLGQREMDNPLLNKLPIGICLVNQDYIITHLNAFFLDRMASELRDEAIGKPIGDVFPEQIKFLKRRIKSVFVLKHPSFSYWEQRPHIFPFKSSRPITGEETQMVQNMEIVPHKDPDTGQLCACILIQDVTAQASYFKAQAQLAEELKAEHEAQRKLIRKLDRAQAQLIQAEKMASTGQLAAGIAHEINNPMGFITANLNTLEQYAKHLLDACQASRDLVEIHSDTELQQQFNQIIQSNHVDLVSEDIAPLIEESKDGLKRVREIVSTLRSFAEDTQTGWGLLNLDETANQLVQLIGVQYKAPTYKVQCEPPNLKWYCESASLKQALTNVLMNAAQSITDKGLVMLSIQQRGAMLHIKILDTGCGINEKHLGRIFEPFFTTRPEGQGQGLGLSVAYTAIENHKGKMVANSKPGKGTVIEILLPALSEKQAEPQDDENSSLAASTQQPESL